LSQVRLLDEKFAVRISILPVGQLNEDPAAGRSSRHKVVAHAPRDVPTVEMLEVQLVNAFGAR
jgi:hypothetical protein